MNEIFRSNKFYLEENSLYDTIHLDNYGYLIYKYIHPCYINKSILGVKFIENEPNVIRIYIKGIYLGNNNILLNKSDNFIMSLNDYLKDFKYIYNKINNREYDFNIINKKFYPGMKCVNINTGECKIRYDDEDDINNSMTIIYKFNKKDIIEIDIIGSMDKNNIIIPDKIIPLDDIYKDYATLKYNY